MTRSRRWLKHLYSARRGVKTPLYDAIRSYGEDAFTVCVMAELGADKTRGDLCALERQMIDQENTLVPHGYNLTPGGDGIHKGYKHVKPSALIGRKLSAETRAKMSASHKGKKPSEAAKVAAIAANKARRGTKWSPKAIAARASYWTPERRQAMRERQTGLRHKPESLAKMRAHWTPETRQRQAEYARATLARRQTEWRVAHGQ